MSHVIDPPRIIRPALNWRTAYGLDHSVLLRRVAGFLDASCADCPVIENGRPSPPSADWPVWQAVDRLIDGTSDIAALRAHRLHLLAVRRWRERGVDIPDALLEEEQLSSVVTLVVPDLLSRISRLYGKPIILHKGPEIAARYPDPALRPYIDLDLLAKDATSVQQTLLAAGFVEVGNPARYEEGAHRRPLALPGLPLFVEVHDDPNWLSWLPSPPTRELIDAAIPSSLDVEGLMTLAPLHHALVVTAHAWSHGPLARVGDLVDVMLMCRGLDRDELLALARRWGLEGLVRTTLTSADAVLFGSNRPRALKVWARNLPDVRERTVFETHVGRWLAGFSALGARKGAAVMADEVAKDLRPAGDETWSTKLRRTRMAISNARVKRSVHDEQLEHSQRQG